MMTTNCDIPDDDYFIGEPQHAANKFQLTTRRLLRLMTLSLPDDLTLYPTIWHITQRSDTRFPRELPGTDYSFRR